VFRPNRKGRYPVILSGGPYGKWLHFEDGYKTAWKRMAEKHPSVTAGSTNKYQSWEVCDPEKWVPDGYVCVRVDSRGCGRSPGYVEHWSPRETRDLFDCIEWAGRQPWSNGKVGLSGISYYASTNGKWRACSRSISRRSASGRASPTSIASSATTAASTIPLPRTGTTCRSRPFNMDWAPRATAAA